MLAGGLRARFVCVDPRRLPRETAGVAFDAALLSALPRDVDPCGENGEFHTFVWDGPMLSGPLRIAAGPRSERDGLAYLDLVPSEAYPVTPAAPASAHLP
jgi:diphthamide synthase (EF-2-diphthine--ammonia ligase)